MSSSTDRRSRLGVLAQDPDSRAHLYEICPDCGHRKLRSSYVCSYCERNGGYTAREREVDPRQQLEQRPHYLVEWAPRNEFRAGMVRFVIGELRAGLSVGIWPAGMILRHSETAQLYVVCLAAGREPPPGAGEEWLPPEKLVKIGEHACSGRLARQFQRSAA
jgi:ribosomal protein L32